MVGDQGRYTLSGGLLSLRLGDSLGPVERPARVDATFGTLARSGMPPAFNRWQNLCPSERKIEMVLQGALGEWVIDQRAMKRSV